MNEKKKEEVKIVDLRTNQKNEILVVTWIKKSINYKHFIKFWFIHLNLPKPRSIEKPCFLGLKQKIPTTALEIIRLNRDLLNTKSIFQITKYNITKKQTSKTNSHGENYANYGFLFFDSIHEEFQFEACGN